MLQMVQKSPSFQKPIQRRTLDTTWMEMLTEKTATSPKQFSMGNIIAAQTSPVSSLSPPVGYYLPRHTLDTTWNVDIGNKNSPGFKKGKKT